MDLSNSFALLNELDESTTDNDKIQRFTNAKNGKKVLKQQNNGINNNKQLENGGGGNDLKNNVFNEQLRIIPGWQDLQDGKEDEQLVLQQPLVWIDLEMTGLDLEKDTILEIGCLITDGQLKTVIEGPNLVVSHSKDVITSMNKWCQQHHYASGLVQKVYASKMTMSQVEESVLKFLKHYLGPNQAQLAGNSVHVDKTFLTKCMPQIVDYLHYRIVDVSTLKELCRRWFPKEYEEMPKPRSTHLAMDDIIQSVKELKYYRRTIFKK
eukprot:TRINITY_DN2258_c1_g1_i2.p1 TRINITY_DN2258_c1_g1~~TRINITY_DN2258_c1_g1_i2.p1  ORF type:complete len:266 (-),score=36.92 TRINITY_DN2258_c1_g1_i2:174-971(-)